MSKQVERTEEERLSEYASHALRGPRFGIFEQLLCQHLVQATATTKPLRKIQLIVEAGLMLNEEKQRTLEINVDRLEVVRAVSEAFAHRNKSSNKNVDLVNVRFGFEECEENYNRFIKPWHHEGDLLYYPLELIQLFPHLGTPYRKIYCATCQNLLLDDLKGEVGTKETLGDKYCKFCNQKLEPYHPKYPPFIVRYGFKPHDSTPEWKMFFAYCTVLSPSGYNQLKTNFLKWTLPFVMELMRKLTKSVRPEIYNEIAKMFIKARREEE